MTKVKINKYGRPYIQGCRLSEKNQQKIYKLADSGISNLAIARVVGISPSCVGKYLTLRKLLQELEGQELEGQEVEEGEDVEGQDVEEGTDVEESQQEEEVEKEVPDFKAQLRYGPRNGVFFSIDTTSVTKFTIAIFVVVVAIRERKLNQTVELPDPADIAKMATHLQVRMKATQMQ